MIPVVYIAGRFRGPTAWDIETNVRKAEVFALEIAKLGAMPLIPHANTRFWHGQIDDQFWLDGTEAMLAKSDALALVPHNWQDSTGTGNEIRFADRHGIPIFAPTPSDFERLIESGVRATNLFEGMRSVEIWIEHQKGTFR